MANGLESSDRSATLTDSQTDVTTLPTTSAPTTSSSSSTSSASSASAVSQRLGLVMVKEAFSKSMPAEECGLDASDTISVEGMRLVRGPARDAFTFERTGIEMMVCVGQLLHGVPVSLNNRGTYINMTVWRMRSDGELGMGRNSRQSTCYLCVGGLSKDTVDFLDVLLEDDAIPSIFGDLSGHGEDIDVSLTRNPPTRSTEARSITGNAGSSVADTGDTSPEATIASAAHSSVRIKAEPLTQSTRGSDGGAASRSDLHSRSLGLHQPGADTDVVHLNSIDCWGARERKSPLYSI